MAIKIRHDGQWVEVGVASSVADGDYGDIIVSNSGATWTLDSSISGDKISEGDSKAEIIDTATESKLTVEIDATEKFSVDIGGPKIHRQDSSNEGGSVVFNRANDDNAAFEIDVYGSSSSDSGRLRILDQSGSSGVERFAIGPAGQIGLSGANYGTSGQVLTSNGSSSAPTWQDASTGSQMFGIPSGGIIMWSGAENLIGSTSTGGTGTGWVLCDGQTYTVDGVSVTPPDLRNRFVVGAGSGGNYNVGDTGGSDNVTLSTDEMPSHDHGSSSVSVSVNSSGLTVSTDSGHNHGSGSLGMDNQGAHAHSQTFYGGGTSGTVPSLRFDGGGTVNFNTSAVGNHVHTISGSTGNGGSHSHSISGSISGSGTLSMSGEGGGQAHENRPPYYALCYIMKS